MGKGRAVVKPLLERSHHRWPVVRRSTPRKKIWRGGKEEGRRASLAARTSGVFWWLHRQPLPRDRETSEDQTAKRVPINTQRRGEEESMEDEEQQQEEMKEYNIDQEEEWQKKLRRALMEEGGLTPEQAMGVMKRVMYTFKEKVADEAKKAGVRVHKEEVEAKKCRSSILMHNADKWVQGDLMTQGYSLAERVTSLVQRL